MRRFVMMAFALMLAIPMAAQDTVTMVMVPKNTLTPQQKQVVEVQSAREWVGLGKEVGEAINSSLAAVTDQTSRFADTKVGRLTVALVVWKVIGAEIVHFVIAGILFFLIFPVIIWSMRKYVAHKYLKTEKFDEKGKCISKEWGETSTNSDGVASHYGLIFALIFACSFIGFSG